MQNQGTEQWIIQRNFGDLNKRIDAVLVDRKAQNLSRTTLSAAMGLLFAAGWSPCIGAR